MFQTRRLARLAAAALAVFGVAALGAALVPRTAAAATTSGCAVSGPLPSGTTRMGRFLGVLPPVGHNAPRVACAVQRASSVTQQSVGFSKPYNNKPPLLYNGGLVMGTGTPGAITITPIYWDPAGAFDPAYESVVNGFISNVATDSGKLTNEFSVELQYGINYQVSAGTPIVDTNPYPPNGCTPDTGAIYSDNSSFTGCLDDTQINQEIQSVVAAGSLPVDLAHLYMMYLPKGIETCYTSADGAQRGGCSVNPADPKIGFCGYHSSVADGPNTLIYTDEPMPVYNSPIGWTCSPQYGPGNESPNGQLDADVELETAVHEIIEATTDPLGTAWYDIRGAEIGDDCSYIYGGGFGGSPGALFDQTINGTHYFVQEMLSNQNFQVKKATACIQAVNLPTAALKIKPGSPKVGVAALLSANKSLGATSYSWNFGDGSPAGSGMSVTHAYTTAGTYTVVLTVTDLVGFQDTTATVSASVVVKP